MIRYISLSGSNDSGKPTESKDKKAGFESLSANKTYLKKKAMYKSVLKKYKLTSLRGASPVTKKRVNMDFQRQWKAYVKILRKKRKVPAPSPLQLHQREFFRNKLKKYGVKSPAQLDIKKKASMFSEIKKEWPGVKRAFLRGKNKTGAKAKAK